MRNERVKAVIIDDDRAAAQLLARELSQYAQFALAGMAHEAEAGLKLLSQTEPDVVFLDVELPDANGIDLLERLDTDAMQCHVVMCTAYSEYMLKAFRNNAFDYLVKPVDPADLAAVVQRLTDSLDSARQQPAAGRMASHAVDDRVLLYLNTTDFKLVKIEEIAMFQYAHSKRVWEAVVAHHDTPVRLKRNLTNERLLDLDRRFVQVSQRHIINVTLLQDVIDNHCRFRPPFDGIGSVRVGRFFRAKLIERFKTL